MHSLRLDATQADFICRTSEGDIKVHKAIVYARFNTFRGKLTSEIDVRMMLSYNVHILISATGS